MSLTTNYLGLELKHPVIASSSPISKSLDGIKRLEDGGASAIVLFSVFEEQIRQEQDTIEFLLGKTSYTSPESLSYFPSAEDYQVGPDGYLELIYDAARSCSVPIIASLNGITELGWVDYAKQMEQSGADAIELNLFFLPLDPEVSSQDVEEQYLNVVMAVRGAVRVPITVKISPFFSATANIANRLVLAGADGLVLFNRFYQPDFDLLSRTVESKLELSGSLEIRLPLLWIAALAGKIEASLAATTGVETSEEVVKYLLAGADAVYTTSALLRNGEGYAQKLVKGLQLWMEQNGFDSVAQMKGSMSLQNCAEPQAFVRANYIKMLQSFRRPEAPLAR